MADDKKNTFDLSFDLSLLQKTLEGQRNLIDELQQQLTHERHAKEKLEGLLAEQQQQWERQLKELEEKYLVNKQRIQELENEYKYIEHRQAIMATGRLTPLVAPPAATFPSIEYIPNNGAPHSIPGVHVLAQPVTPPPAAMRTEDMEMYIWRMQKASRKHRYMIEYTEHPQNSMHVLYERFKRHLAPNDVKEILQRKNIHENEKQQVQRIQEEVARSNLIRSKVQVASTAPDVVNVSQGGQVVATGKRSASDSIKFTFSHNPHTCKAATQQVMEHMVEVVKARGGVLKISGCSKLEDALFMVRLAMGAGHGLRIELDDVTRQTIHSAGLDGLAPAEQEHLQFVQQHIKNFSK
jgi:hypothetical protein